MQAKNKGWGYAALGFTSIVWGTTWVASKIAVQEVPALQLTYIRQFLAGICLVSFFLLVKKVPFPNAKQFRWLFVMAFLMIVFANGFSVWGIQYIPAGLGALIGALYPLSVVIIERVFFKQKNLTAITFVGLFLGITGIAIVFYEHAFAKHGPNFIIGVCLSVFAMLSWSFGTVFLSRNKQNLNPYFGIGWQMLISSFVLLLMSQSFGKNIPISSISLKSWGLIFYLVVAGSIGAFIAFIYSMKKLPAAIASLYAYINPLVAMIVASIVLKEHLTLNILWGSITTLLGVFMVNYSIRKTQEKIIAEADL